jgi:hypothetical protein
VIWKGALLPNNDLLMAWSRDSCKLRHTRSNLFPSTFTQVLLAPRTGSSATTTLVLACGIRHPCLATTKRRNLYKKNGLGKVHSVIDQAQEGFFQLLAKSVSWDASHRAEEGLQPADEEQVRRLSITLSGRLYRATTLLNQALRDPFTTKGIRAIEPTSYNLNTQAIPTTLSPSRKTRYGLGFR